MAIFQKRIAWLLAACVTAASIVGCRPGSLAPPGQRPNSARVLPVNASPIEKLIAAGVNQTTYTFTYDPSYVKLDYPMGDVPRDRGACTDVIVRAFHAAGIDL